MQTKQENWDRHHGLVWSDAQLIDDGVRFAATAPDGATWRFHLEIGALKSLGAEEFYDDDVLGRFEVHRADIEKVAGSLVMLGVKADPILLKRSYFTESPWRRVAQAC
ncbi:MAG: hypothetical protein AB7P21_03855 [Lautropia sp.]